MIRLEATYHVEKLPMTHGSSYCSWSSTEFGIVMFFDFHCIRHIPGLSPWTHLLLSHVFRLSWTFGDEHYSDRNRTSCHRSAQILTIKLSGLGQYDPQVALAELWMDPLLRGDDAIFINFSVWDPFWREMYEMSVSNMSPRNFMYHQSLYPFRAPEPVLPGQRIDDF